MQREIETFALDFRRNAQTDDRVEDLQQDEGDDRVVDNHDENAFARLKSSLLLNEAEIRDLERAFRTLKQAPSPPRLPSRK